MVLIYTSNKKRKKLQEKKRNETFGVERAAEQGE